MNSSRPVAKRAQTPSHVHYPQPSQRPQQQLQHPNPPNHALRSVNQLPQDINYVDLTHRSKIRNLHLAYLSLLIVTAVTSFYVATLLIKPRLITKTITINLPAPELPTTAASMAESALSDNAYRYKSAPHVNTFDQSVLRNQIYEKYDKAKAIVSENFHKESEERSHKWTGGNFYATDEYFTMKRQFEAATLELEGQKYVELCEKTNMLCDQAEDYKNSKHRVASVGGSE